VGSPTLCQFFLAKKVMEGNAAGLYSSNVSGVPAAVQAGLSFVMLACSGASLSAWPQAGASVPQRCTCRSRTRREWRVHASKDNKEGDRGVDWDGAWEKFKSTAAKGEQSSVDPL
jgi:hypothetical protein